MKKFFSVFFVLCAAITTTMLMSCGSDDDDKVKTQVVTMQFEANDDFMSLLDISVVYTDENGNTKTEAMNGKFSKTLTISNFPASGTFCLKTTPKSSFTEGRYNPSLQYTLNIGGLSKSNTYNFQKTYSSSSSVQTLADTYNKYKWSWSFLADGTREDK